MQRRAAFEYGLAARRLTAVRECPGHVLCRTAHLARVEPFAQPAAARADRQTEHTGEAADGCVDELRHPPTSDGAMRTQGDMPRHVTGCTRWACRHSLSRCAVRNLAIRPDAAVWFVASPRAPCRPPSRERAVCRGRIRGAPWSERQGYRCARRRRHNTPNTHTAPCARRVGYATPSLAEPCQPP
jgi:hypothetical protein